MPSPLGVKVLGIITSRCTFTVTEAVAAQPSVVCTVNVYSVVDEGLAVGSKINGSFNPVDGVQVVLAMLPVAVAVNTTELPTCMVLSPPPLTMGSAKIFIVVLLLVVFTGVAQAALLVMVQLITSPFAKLLLVNVGLLPPTLLPFTNHWYCGAVPPFTGVAVNVMGVPSQTLLSEVAMLTDGIKIFTVMEILLLVAFGVVIQAALLVRLQLTTSPLVSVLLTKVGLLLPALTPFTSHW